MDFSKIWGSNGNVSEPTDAQYLQGFDFLGSAPPTVELFNYLFQVIDLKLKELKDSDATLFWQPAIDYEVGDVRFPATGAYKYLECTVAGTSGPTEPTWPAPGNTVTDGGVTWIVRDLRVATDRFDNSNKLVTTAWLKQRGSESSQVISLTAAQTLVAANAGQSIILYAATPAVTVMPLLTSVPDGATFEFVNLSAVNQTISGQGANKILVNGGASIASVIVQPGDSLVLRKGVIGTDVWYAFGGTSMLKTSSSFLKSFVAAGGYQKLPSGLIIQWGQISVTMAANTTTDWAFTLPTAFPTAGLQASIVPANQVYSGAQTFCSIESVGLATIAGKVVSNTAFSQSFRVIAIGY